mmetsp:Transcript_19822/g.33160  ORF Transcript_19822/g.33160 Transcript_19822/m.33160 type:complete len:82 (-) Transcript_19822:1-246(-)
MGTLLTLVILIVYSGKRTKVLVLQQHLVGNTRNITEWCQDFERRLSGRDASISYQRMRTKKISKLVDAASRHVWTQRTGNL